jgi:hypothetical protein
VQILLIHIPTYIFSDILPTLLLNDRCQISVLSILVTWPFSLRPDEECSWRPLRLTTLHSLRFCPGHLSPMLHCHGVGRLKPLTQYLTSPIADCRWKCLVNIESPVFRLILFSKTRCSPTTYLPGIGKRMRGGSGLWLSTARYMSSP